MVIRMMMMTIIMIVVLINEDDSGGDDDHYVSDDDNICWIADHGSIIIMTLILTKIILDADLIDGNLNSILSLCGNLQKKFEVFICE